MKEEFIKLLKETNREGMDKVISFLENSDFFTAPASTRFHGSKENGLLEHSMKVYEILQNKVKNSVIEINASDQVVCVKYSLALFSFYFSNDVFSVFVYAKESP